MIYLEKKRYRAHVSDILLASRYICLDGTKNENNILGVLRSTNYQKFGLRAHARTNHAQPQAGEFPFVLFGGGFLEP